MHGDVYHMFYLPYESSTAKASLCSATIHTLTTWHCPHSPAARSAAVRHAAIYRYLLPAGHIAKFAAVAHAGTDRRTDGRTPDRCIDPVQGQLRIFCVHADVELLRWLRT